MRESRPRNCEDVSGNSPIFVFVIFVLRKKKAPEITRNFEDVSRRTPVLPLKKIRQCIILFTDLTAEPAAKLWGRLKPIVLFSLVDLLFVFERKNSGENAKLRGRLKPNARFPQKKIRTIFHVLDTLENEIVRTSQAKTSVFETQQSIRRPCPSVKLWGRLKRNVRFSNFLSRKKTREIGEIVRMSQPKRPVLEKSVPFSPIIFFD